MNFIKRACFIFAEAIFSSIGYNLVRKIPPMPKYNVERIIDVGVAKGTPQLLNNYSSCYFILIEPHPFYHNFINNNILNKINGTLLKFAAGEKDEILQLKDNGPASGFFDRNDNKNILNFFDVKVRPLDDLLAEIGFFSNKKNVLLKVDTEGFELNVLKGAVRILSESFVKYVVLEVRVSFINNNYNPTEIFVFLQEFGFKFLRIDKVAHRKKGISFLDITFYKE